MTSPTAAPAAPRLTLDAARAADLMSPNPVSIRAEATIPEAIATLTQRGFSAAPVIGESGRPVGVVSRADILIHLREAAAPDGTLPAGATRVQDIMTPAVFSATPEMPADRVVEQLVTLNVHQLYVVDGDQALIGVISALDVLRRLRPA